MHYVTNTGVVCTTQVEQKLISCPKILWAMQCISMLQSNMVQTVTQVIKIGDLQNVHRSSEVKLQCCWIQDSLINKKVQFKSSMY